MSLMLIQTVKLKLESDMSLAKRNLWNLDYLQGMW